MEQPTTLPPEFLKSLSQLAKNYVIDFVIPRKPSFLPWAPEHVHSAYYEGMVRQAEAAQPLIDALERNITLERERAANEQGELDLAESWESVKIARKAIRDYYSAVKKRDRSF